LYDTEPLFDSFAPRKIERAGPADPHPAARSVVVISIDGLAEWVLESSPQPNLARFAHEGVAATVADTVLPSFSLIAYTSLLTGLSPEKHEVGWNRYLPWRHIDAETLFTHCAKAGLRCGLFAGSAKLAYFAENEPGVAHFELVGSAAQVLEHALAWMKQADPDFVLIEIADLTLLGRSAGWGSEAQLAGLARVDRLLGSFVAEAEKAGTRPLTIILTSDHGGHGTQYGTDLARDIRIPWIAWGDGAPPGATIPYVSILDNAPTVLLLLGQGAPSEMAGRVRLGGILCDITHVDPSIQVDMRYAKRDNFLKEAIYPVNRCLLRADVAQRLARVQRRLVAQGFGLRMWDCYRPQSVQQRMWDLVSDPRYVADPRLGSNHSRASAVDVTLVDKEGNPVQMPTKHDDFSDRARRDYTNLPAPALRHRKILEDAMTAEGFIPLPTEWWHFDDPESKNAPLLDQPFGG
jgi:D-alanyl-D-alanine dipeptidase